MSYGASEGEAFKYFTDDPDAPTFDRTGFPRPGTAHEVQSLPMARVDETTTVHFTDGTNAPGSYVASIVRKG